MSVRLGCAQAIRAAVETADYVYKAAGMSAIFQGTPFERRFRDIHTLSQQIQSRDAHFEAVGKIMFNGDPDGVFLYLNRRRQNAQLTLAKAQTIITAALALRGRSSWRRWRWSCWTRAAC